MPTRGLGEGGGVCSLEIVFVTSGPFTTIWFVSVPVSIVNVERAFSKLGVINRQEWASIDAESLEKHACSLKSDKATSDVVVTSSICNLIFILILYVLLTNKRDIACISLSSQPEK